MSENVKRINFQSAVMPETFVKTHNFQTACDIHRSLVQIPGSTRTYTRYREDARRGLQILILEIITAFIFYFYVSLKKRGLSSHWGANRFSGVIFSTTIIRVLKSYLVHSIFGRFLTKVLPRPHPPIRK